MKKSAFLSRAYDFRIWLKNLPIQDPVERRVAVLFQVILLGLIAVDILGMIVNLAIPSLSSREKLIGAAANLAGAFVIGLLLGLLRRGHVRSAALLLIMILFTTPTLAVIGAADIPVNGGVFFQFTLAIILAGLLVSRRALAFAFGLSAALVAFGAFGGTRAESQSVMDGLSLAVNFILLNGIIALFLDRFSITLRAALNAALERESELQIEVSNRKQAEETLRQSEERYRKLVNSARDVIFTISTEGIITSLNPAFDIFTGWSRAEWLGRSFDELVAGDDRTWAYDQFNRILRGETVRALRLRIHGRAGESLVVEMNIAPQFKDDQVVGLLGIARDMTQEQQAEDALKASERRFRALIENAWDAFTLADAQGTILYASPSTERLLGYTAEEFVGVNFFTFFHPDDIALARAKLIEVMQASGNVVAAPVRIRHKDGAWRWMEGVVTNLFAEPDVRALVINYRDITEHKQAEDGLRESEERFRSIFQTAAVSIWEEDYSEVRAALDELRAQGVADFRRYLAEHPGFAQRAVQMVKVLDVNEATLKLYGAKEKTELLGKLENFVKPDDLHEELIAFAEGRTYFEKETSDHRLDGSLINLWMTITFFTDAAGFHKALVCLSDITARKQAEEKIQRQNQRLKALREIDTAILSADSVENIVGAALDHTLELIGGQRAVLSLIDWEANETVVFNVRTINETSIPRGTRVPLALFQGIAQTLSKNETVLISDLRALADPPPLFQNLIKEGLRSVCILPLFSQNNLIGAFSMASETPGFFDEEKISLGREVANQVAIAITQSRLVEALEERVHEREKLITELTAKNAELESFIYTVSHDLKSPLVTMKGFLGYLEQDAATGNMERLKGDTQRIANAVDKMQELLKDLLELSRIGRFINPLETIPFGELIRVALEIVQGQIEARGVTVQIQPNLPVVYGDRQRLIEALQNLLDNAAKYMGGQPQPLIEIGQRGEDAERGQQLFYVKDNGIGIAPEHRERVFGLFNKLDARSEGTGIGLALVRRIIEVHGGRIWVESEAGMGSTFYFSLPGASGLEPSTG